MNNHLRALTVAAIAATTLLGASPAHAADVKATPTIATDALLRLIPYNTNALAAFVVKADNVPMARRPVKICTAPLAGDWVCVNGMTTSAGKVIAMRSRVTAPVRMNVIVPESDNTEAATSDTVVIKPQVALTVVRKKATMTVTLSVAADQHLVVKRQEGPRWVLDRYQQVTDRVTTVDDLQLTKRYQVTISDTVAIIGNSSKAV
jgi:hypothetical protein